MDSRVRWKSMLAMLRRFLEMKHCVKGALKATALKQSVLQNLSKQSSGIAKKLFNAMKNRIEERRNASLCGLLCYLDDPSNYVSSSNSNCILTRI
ncbi:hypothetical protein T11_12249 [Trichinella zimbabwensis]|uniref:Uncharacterized protein n=1 Tax=Trichinella zimbabwensis TaxID=268475 RepID=A0A0V1H3T6_9BILA|nr:hypothetical protein T11_12249 [Trichinella zimbabwensis]